MKRRKSKQHSDSSSSDTVSSSSSGSESEWSVINWWAGEKETHKKEKKKKVEWICKMQGQEESKEEKERDKRQVSGCNYTTNTSIHKHLTNTYKKCKSGKNEYCE